MVEEKIMKRICTIILSLVLALSLVACGTQSSSEAEKVSKKDDIGIKNEINIGSDEAKNENQPSDDASKDEGIFAGDDKSDGNTSSVGEGANDRHYYSKVVITSTNLNIGDFIYGVDSALMDFGFFDGAAYWGYEPSFTITFDTSTGKAVKGVLKGYVSAFGGGEGETNYEELFEEAISCSSELSGKIYGFTRDVVERGDENYPIVTCISANVDVSEYWANFEQYISLYFIERTQDVEGLADAIMREESNGLSVSHGSNYIVNPIGGLKYEWFD